MSAPITFEKSISFRLLPFPDIVLVPPVLGAVVVLTSAVAGDTAAEKEKVEAATAEGKKEGSIKRKGRGTGEFEINRQERLMSFFVKSLTFGRQLLINYRRILRRLTRFGKDFLARVHN
jgi:hypothetical protein